MTVCGRINVYRVCFEWGTASWCYLKFPISALTPLAITVAGDKHKVKIIKYPRLGELLDLFHVTVTPTPTFFFFMRNAFNTLEHMAPLIAFSFIPMLLWSRTKALIPLHKSIDQKREGVLWCGITNVHVHLHFHFRDVTIAQTVTIAFKEA